jgi:hypothetical protein
MVLMEDGGRINHELRRLIGLFVERGINAFPTEPLERPPDVLLGGTNSGSIGSQVGAECPEMASEKFVRIIPGNLPNLSLTSRPAGAGAPCRCAAYRGRKRGGQVISTALVPSLDQGGGMARRNLVDYSGCGAANIV